MCLYNRGLTSGWSEVEGHVSTPKIAFSDQESPYVHLKMRWYGDISA